MTVGQRIWLEGRHSAGVMLPPFHTIMPAPDSDGNPAQRPLTSNEASQWLRKLLTGEKKVDVHRKISVHSCKVTCLSFCAKYGIDAMTRLQLGYHSGGGSGLRMVHIYSRDAASEPLARLIQVLDDIRAAKFLAGLDEEWQVCAGLSSLNLWTKGAHGRLAERNQTRLNGLTLLATSLRARVTTRLPPAPAMRVRRKSFRKSRRGTKCTCHLRPPAGYVFWQHSRMKTLHLALPGI